MNPLSFLQYILSPNDKKRSDLIGLARNDGLYEDIVALALKHDLQIRFGYWGVSGSYKVVQNNEAVHPEIFLSTRFGQSMNAHYFLHELIHFYQHTLGLFFEELNLDLHAYVKTRLFCEAMAHTEAIKASWRLHHKGIDKPWKGARFSMDWRGQAKAYQVWIMEFDERTAGQKLFERWFKTTQKNAYERMFKKRYNVLSVQKNAPCDSLTPQNILERLPDKRPYNMQETYEDALNQFDFWEQSVRS